MQQSLKLLNGEQYTIIICKRKTISKNHMSFNTDTNVLFY
jgi:hypothetical protein